MNQSSRQQSWQDIPDPLDGLLELDSVPWTSCTTSEEWYHNGLDHMVDVTQRVDSASSSANDLNSILCETYSVKSGDRADVYLTDGPAKISHSMREVIRVSDMGLMADDNFDFRAFYLLPGSEIEVRACMHQLAILHARVDVIIVRGDDKFRKWLGDTSCADCIEHRIALPPLGLCSIAHYVVEKKDTYYVIFTRAHRQDARQPVRAELDMKVSKTIYDFTNAKQTCHLARSCQLNLTYGASDDVIVQFPGKGTLPATSTYFTTECQLRRAFWVVVFGVVPAVLILLLLTCCLCSMRSSAKHSAAMREKKKRVGRAFTVSDNQTKQTESAGDANPAV
nr:hypothetical protein BaRGS_021195 [Batillaria attramentaria]